MLLSAAQLRGLGCVSMKKAGSAPKSPQNFPKVGDVTSPIPKWGLPTYGFAEDSAPRARPEADMATPCDEKVPEHTRERNCRQDEAPSFQAVSDTGQALLRL